MLLIYVDEPALAEARKDVAGAQIMPAYIACTGAMKQAGVLVGGDRLAPTSTATTVRATGGKTKILNGPYAETKERLGGCSMIDVPDLDAAIAWASRCPGASPGVIEVRPLFTG